MRNLIRADSCRLELAMRIIDVAMLESAGHLAGLAHFDAPLTEVPPVHVVMLHFCSALAFLAFPQLDLYVSWRGRSLPGLALRLAASWGAVLLAGLFFCFVIHRIGHVSRLWLFYWYASGWSLLLLYRLAIHAALRGLRARGFHHRRVVIVGYGNTGREMHRRVLRQDWIGYQVKAVHADAADERGILDPAVARIGSLQEIPDYVIANRIHEIWITLPLVVSPRLLELQYLLRNVLLDIRWIPDVLGLQMLGSKTGDFLGFPVVDLNQVPSHGLNGIAKNLFDRLFAALALIVLLPLFAVIAAGIKCSSPGPVFVRLPRTGLDGREFNMVKFRTGPMQPAHRATPIGGFLMRTGLDELPQFINVLLGDMSVVGPRTCPSLHDDAYEDVPEIYILRHRVKPGITGWAQIHGCGSDVDAIDRTDRVQFDLHYVRNWSLWMDMRIIAWTAFNRRSGRDAY